MSGWDPAEIRASADRDFEAAWLDTADLIKKEGTNFQLRKGDGDPHPIERSRQQIRSILLEMGFDEVIPPLIWEDEHVARQYGPESAVILDRCYYLAGLPRPEIGLSKDKLERIREIVPGFSAVDRLTTLLRDYKAGRVESDDFVEEMVDRLEIHEEQATEIIDKVFAEMKRLEPLPTNLTVLSHFTTAWFPILSRVLTKKICPVQLFTTGLRMRREQREDATHLRSHYNASIVVMDEDFTLEDGRRLARRVVERLGFKDLDFVTKKATSKYYSPGSEEEVFARHPSSEEEIEIADLGMYSPVALSRYDIPYPVFNMGFGIGRLAMIERDVSDIRELTYPEIQKPPFFSDRQMENSLEPTASPKTGTGRGIMQAIVETARTNAGEEAPCSFPAWKGSLYGKRVEVELTETEEGHTLTGPAAFNTISVEDGSIVSHRPKAGESDQGLTYMKSVASYAAAETETMAQKGETGTGEIRVGMVRSPSDIYLSIPLAVRRYIESNNNRIDIAGPMFATIRYTIG